MPISPDETGGLPAAYLTTETSSFSRFVTANDPAALARARAADADAVAEGLPHGTTIVSVVFDGGVLMVGDRQLTAGTSISNRYAEKVFLADPYSCVGVAGTAALAFEMARLFQLELEHYEKLEGVTLSLPGKANRLGGMVRANLPMALEGMVALPLYAGYDLETGTGRIFGYDASGARSEEREGYQSIGSGSVYAASSLKKLYRHGLPEDEAIVLALQALYDAAEEDTATMGPDVGRDIYPTVHVVNAEGGRRLADAEVGTIARQVIEQRLAEPGGPRPER